MTIPAAAASGVSGAGQRSAPTRIGQARPSHLITTAGVGATVDLPSISVIVRGLDAWNPEQQDPVDEPRLLEAVQRVLGPQVRALRHAPWDPGANDDPLTRTGVPVTPFPRWVRCPRCYRLGPLDPPGQFELIHRWGRRPDLAKYVHAQCLRQASLRVASRRACVPARFPCRLRGRSPGRLPVRGLRSRHPGRGRLRRTAAHHVRRGVHPRSAGDGPVRDVRP